MNQHDDGLDPWDRQPGESPIAFHAFTHFRDLAPGTRRMRRAVGDHYQQCEHRSPPSTTPSRWELWASRFGWRDRVALYDRHVDGQVRAALIQKQADARERHARLAQAALSALSVPIRAILEALATPHVLARLTAMAQTPAGMAALLALVGRLAPSVPGLVAVERSALGLRQDAEMPVEGDIIDTTLVRVGSDPHATDLAVQLLDRLSILTPVSKTIQ